MRIRISKYRYIYVRKKYLFFEISTLQVKFNENLNNFFFRPHLKNLKSTFYSPNPILFIRLLETLFIDILTWRN